MLPFGIDPMSVATQGHLEGLGPTIPVVSTPRDELRIATLGWIIIDFEAIPDPNTPSDANIRPFLSCPLIEEPRAIPLLQKECYSFTLDESRNEAKVGEPLCLGVDIMGPSSLDVRVWAPVFVVTVQNASSEGKIEPKKMEADLEGRGSEAELRGSSTDTEFNDE